MLRRIWGFQTRVDWTLRLGPFDGPVAETGRLQMNSFLWSSDDKGLFAGK